MGRFKEKMYRFMYGRYGADELYNFLAWLNVGLIFAELILTLIIPDPLARVIVSSTLSVLVLLVFILEIYRSMSRNIAKRRRENEIYLKARRALSRFFSGNTSRKTRTYNRDDAAHIFRDCTHCGSTLRLPRRVGKHRVKCPRCAHSFYVKAKKFKYKKF